MPFPLLWGDHTLQSSIYSSWTCLAPCWLILSIFSYITVSLLYSNQQHLVGFFLYPFSLSFYLILQSLEFLKVAVVFFLETVKVQAWGRCICLAFPLSAIPGNICPNSLDCKMMWSKETSDKLQWQLPQVYKMHNAFQEWLSPTCPHS